MLVTKIIRNRIYGNNSFLKIWLVNAQSFNITSSEQLRNCYPFFLNSNKNIYSYSGLHKNNFQNHKIRYKSTDSVTIKKEGSTTEEHVSIVSEKIKIIETPALTRTEKLKKAVKDYGSTVIVFHVGISLISLGTCYLLVSSGLDVAKIIEAVGLDRWITKTDIATSAGTFAVAYAIHKIFAPVRITITLGSVPFIVRYLRKVGFLKK